MSNPNENQSFMKYWSDVIESYPGDGRPVILILMCLAFGPSYPSKIVEHFKYTSLLNIPGCRCLGYENRVADIMKDMANDKLITAYDCASIRLRSCYKFNPEILCSPFISPDSTIFTTDEVLAFLNVLSRINKQIGLYFSWNIAYCYFGGETPVEEFLSSCIRDKISRFPYINFLYFLESIASALVLKDFIKIPSSKSYNVSSEEMQIRTDLMMKVSDGLFRYTNFIITNETEKSEGDKRYIFKYLRRGF